MKRFVRCLMLFAALSVGWAANAQSLFDYTFSTGVDSTRWVNLTNYTDLSSGGSGDYWYSSVTNIGFTFPFGENEYTQFSVNSDGNLRLGSTVTGMGYYSTPFSGYNANYNAPKINFFGCDGFLVSGTHYVHSQTFGDTMLVVEFCLGPYNSNYRNQQFRWQVQLYASGNIQVVFATTQGTSSYSYHQMGLCVDASEGWVVNSSNQAVSFTNGSDENWGHSLWPSGNYYCFTRPVFTCLPLRDVVVSNIDLYSATVSWSLRDSSQTNFIVSYGLGTDTANYTEVSVTGTSYTIPGLLPASNYNVRVKAVCAADDQSIWTTLTPFTTLLCASTDQCPVIVNLNDSYGDGWNGGYLTLEDSITGHVLHTFELPYGSSAVDTAYICNLRNCNIVWHPGGFDGEVSFVVFDNLGDTIFAAASYPSDGVIHTFYSLCIEPDCWPVENVTVDALDYSANVSWSLHDSTQNTFVVAYGTGANPDYLTQMNVTGTTATITGLDLATTYNVYVKAVCSADEQSTWVGPVAFSTPLCPQSEQCYVYMSLGMNYYSSWHGGNFALVDSTTGTTVHTFQYDYDHTATWDSAQICNGHVYNLVWTPSSSYYYNYYIHAVLFDINGDTLYAPTSFIDTSTFSFISNCTYYSCRRLQNVFVDDVTDTSVNLHWTLIDSSQTNFVVAYGIGSDPDNMPQVAVSGTTATITGLNPGINYDVYVKPVCSTDDHGPWTHAVATTNPCSDADMCYIIVEKASAWSDWGSTNLALVDSANGSTFRLISYQYLEDGSVDSILVCPDRTYYLQVTGPNSYWYPDEHSFTIRDYLGLPICNSDFFSADTMLKVRTTCAPPTCWPVHDVTVASYDNHNATITWDLYDNTQTNFVVAYGTGNNPDSLTQVNCATTSAMLTGLDSSTTYNVFVKAVCNSNDHSNWSFATTFTTSMCPASDMCRIYVQLNNSIPDDWAGQGMWLVDSVTNETVCQIDLNELAETVYDSLYVCTGRTYVLEFPTDYYGRGVIDSGFASYASMLVTSVAGEEIHTYHFEPYWSVEEVTFVADCSIPSCLTVRDVTVTDVEDSTAALSWELRDPTQTTFVVAYGTGTNPDSLTQATVATNSYMLSGLTPATEYNVYVKAVCSDLDHSSWSPVTSFITAACASAEMCPIYVSVTPGNSYDWYNITPLTIFDSVTGVAVHRFDLSEMCSSSVGSNVDSAYLCPGRVYSFLWEGDYGGTSSVITVTDHVGEILDTANFTYYSRYDYQFTFTSSCEIPTCMTVSNVAVSNVDTASATVSWSLRDAAQTSFVVAYGTSTNPDSLTQATATSTSYQITGLTPGTQYYVFVKAVCSGIDHSSWSPAVAFTTPLCPAENQCYVYIDMADSYGDGWNNGFLTMVDTLTGNTVASFSMNQGSNAADSAVVCVDRVYGLQWHSGYYDSEVSFTLRNILGDTIYSAEDPDEDSVLYFTAVCDTTPQPGVSVTVAVNNPTMGTTNPAPGVYNYAVNDTLVATAVPAPGYHFVEWHVSIDSNSFTDTTTTIHQPIYFFMDGQTISLTAYFDVDPVAGVSLSVNDSTMGTTNPAPGFYEFSEGDTMSVTAVPSDGYHFVNWTISIGFNTFTDSNAVLTQVVSSAMLDQTITVTANFEQDDPIIDTNEYCNVTVVMHDSYGDGWNGNSWLKFVDNATSTTVDSVKLLSGSLDTAYVSVIDGHSYSLVWNAGSYDYEDSFEVYDILGLNIYSGSSLTAGTLHTFTAVCSIPSCMPVIGVAVNYSGGTTANVSWSLVDSTQSNFVVAYGTGTNPDSLTQITATTTSATLTGLSLGSGYNVFVRAVCGSDYGDWSTPAYFVTDLCLAEDQCMVYAQLTDSYGDGWNNAHLLLVDSLTGAVAHDFTLSSGSSLTDSAAVCPGRVYNLVWSSGSYDSETSFSLSDIAGITIFSDSYPSAGVLHSFTANCTLPECATVQSVSVSNITTSSADVSWTLRDTTQTDFLVAYGTGTNPDSLTQVSVTGTSTTLTGFSSATMYNVFVKAVCGSDNSDWSPATSFVTSFCPTENQCSVTLQMADQYADTWNDGYLSLVDSLTGATVHTFEMSDGVYSETDSATVCVGRTYSLYWNGGYYDEEVSFSLISAYGDTLYSDQDPDDGTIFTFTASCVAPVVPEATVILAVNDSTMGTTLPVPGTYSFVEGDTMSATAVAVDGYHFVNWTISIGFNTFTDSNAVLTQVVSSAMLNQTITVTANFAQDPVATLILAVNDSTMGTTTPAPGTYSYHNGDTAVVTAVPATGYHFLYWSLNYDMFNLTDTHITLTQVVDANFLGHTVSLTAVFAEDTIVLPETTVILTVNDATMGTTLPAPGTYIFHEGDTMAVTAVPSSGYHFSNWTISNGVITLTETSTTLVQVVNAMFLNQTLTVTANFSQDTVVQPVATVNLAVNDSTMGTTVPAPGTYTFHQGDTMSATAVAAPGYHFVNWTISNALISLTDSNATLSQVVNALFLNQTINVTANFEQDTPSIDTNEYCNVTVVMHDSYGDGWNGNSWLKFVDNATNTVADSVKLTSGSLDTAYVSVIDGHSYSLVWTTGSYDYEDSFEVYDILGLNIYSGSSLTAGTLHTFTAVCSIPSCMPVIGVAVNYSGGTTANVSWSLVDSTQSNFVVAYGTGTNPDSLTQITATTTSATITGLSLGSGYNVFVRAVCGSDYGDWSTPAYFVTDLCLAEDQCMVYAQLTDSYGDGWNNAHLLLVDSLTGGVAHDFTLSSGSSLTDSAAVCPGRVYNLVWSSGSYDPETSFSLSDIAGITIFSDSYPTAGVLYSFTANCTLPECASVQYVSVGSVTDSTATISWTPRDSTQSIFMVAYGTGTNPDSLSQVAVTGTSTTLTGLSLASTYNVFVKAVCGTDLSSTWSEGVSFNTPICSQDDQCYVTIYMNDSYGDGWNGGSLSVVDSLTGITVGNFTIDDGSSAVDSAAVCIGRTYNLVWNTGSFGSEVSFAVINTALDTVLSATYPSGGFLTSFVASCDEPALPFSLTLATANAAMGTTNPAPGTYTYFEGDTITISAVEYNHYDFAYWSLTYGTMTYSDTTATVSMVVLPAMAGLSATVTANFEPETYTVSATPNNSVHGTVTGGGSYQYGDTVTLVATANATSHFVSWSDGALTTTRQFIVVSDTTFVANFAYNPVTLTVANSDSTMGTVLPAPGVYQYNVGDTVTVSATALTGYSFDDWSFTVGSAHNTVTTNPYSFVVPASYAGLTANITANWEVNYYTITALSNDTALGTVTGGGSYAYNTSATLQAVPATHCHFVQWNDGNTNATRTVLVTGDATYTATFAYDSVTIVMAVSDAAMGTVNPTTGSYTYAVGDTLTIEATPNAGYQFMNWTVRANGYTTVTDNPINLVIPAAYAGMSVTYTAQFAYDTITVVLAVDDASMGTVNPAPGTYYFVLGDTLTAEALPTIGYEFVGWSLDGGSASLVDNPLTQVFTASQAGQTITYTAFFQVSQQYNVTLSVVDSLGNANVGGSVSGDGAYYPGTEVTITATPAYGYHFVSWTTAEGQLVTTDTVYTFVMGDRDVAFVATFAQNAGDHTGIDDTEFSNIVIFSHGDRIVVRGAENQTIRVFDVVGRLVAQRSDAAEEESIQLTNTGVYLVKVGNAPARRVVIRR